MNYIFDVDGTLTPSRQKIDFKFAEFFKEFCENNDVYLVTGSDRSKTMEQLGEDIYNACKKVYQCSGNQVYEGKAMVREVGWVVEPKEVVWLEDRLAESKFPLRTGKHIEFRPGMVNFSTVGRGATLGERLLYVKFDDKNQERVKIAKKLKEEFPHLEAVVGGETGIDIFPVGRDKSQIIGDFRGPTKFYGDRMDPEGNDYPLAQVVKHMGGETFEVEDWKHTFKLLSLEAMTALSSAG